MSQPWLKFYPTDWRADPALRSCSLVARGLWMEILCLMHEASPRGSLLINGQRVTEKQLASLTGAPLKQVAAGMVDLEVSGVFSRDDDGTIYSRRMRRDEEKAARDKANGKMGGNPRVILGVNPPVNGEDKAQILEARSQSPEKKMNGAVGKPTRPPDDPLFERFWKAYPSRGTAANPKAPARKVFAQAVKAGTDPEAIIAAVVARVGVDAAKVGTEFIPQAERWLRQRRWEDRTAEVTEPPTNLVHVMRESDDWDSWAARWRAHKGRDPPVDGKGGWHFPREWAESTSEAAA